MQVGDLNPGVHPQCRIKVRQRFVKEEEFRLAHNGPADGNPLTLTARQFRGVAVQVLFQIQHPAGLGHTGVDHLFRAFCLFQGQCHVVAHIEVRVERVALEHHGDATFGGRGQVDQILTNVNIARGGILQPGNHPQQGGFATARGANEDNKFAFFDL